MLVVILPIRIASISNSN